MNVFPVCPLIGLRTDFRKKTIMQQLKFGIHENQGALWETMGWILEVQMNPSLNCYGGIWLKTTLTFSNAMLFVYSQWKFTMLTPPVKCPRTFYPGEFPAGKIWLRFKTTRTLVNIWPLTGALRRGFTLGWIKRKSGTETKPNPFVW